ncbi:MAG: hypothetical protein NZ927_00910 [Candidatus Calescibacterium sp.]|nr:hypothetical protein [Candidatus Calescibacterium sp.]MCX7733728.1 hypothetical protein [bacterium]MDW8087488.1 cytochrome c3 family protein [Candidatus Calescibacterium sp.]
MILKRKIIIFIFGIFGIFFVVKSQALTTSAFLKLDRAPNIEDEEPLSIFPHLIHQRMFACFRCHPSIFSYGRDTYTHKDFDSGKYCGECHNGSVAWHIDDVECETCHLE